MSDQLYYAKEETSLAVAWGHAFLAAAKKPGREFTPFLVSIVVTEELENKELRNLIDQSLEVDGHQSIETVSNTIFPESLWRRAKGDRSKLFASYLENLPDYVSMEPRKNCRGLYFARLVGFGINPKTGEHEEHLDKDQLKCEGNQLEYIITTCKPGAQRMALQVAIYDPVRDQTPARQSFPCLQHVTFVPDFNSGTLSLNAFYATQQLYVKAYGNWLGLIRLGKFMASQVGLSFHRLNCSVGIEKMDDGMRPKDNSLFSQLKDVASLVVSSNGS